MSYGIKSNTQESLVSSPINAGIQDNIKLESVEFSSMSEDKPPVLQFNFADEYGGTLRYIHWEVNEQQVREFTNQFPREHSRSNSEHGFVAGNPVTEDDAVLMAYDLFNQIALHIATKFVTKEQVQEATESATSYAEFCEAYAALFTPSVLANGNPVRLKVVLDKKDYSVLAKYPPFIENMTVPREQSKLSIRQNERVEKLPSNGADSAESYDSFKEEAVF